MIDRAASAELMTLVERLIEDRLSADELTRLEELVLADSELAAQYVHFVSMHATLMLDRGAPVKRPLPVESSSTAADEPLNWPTKSVAGAGVRQAQQDDGRGASRVIAWCTNGVVAAAVLAACLALVLLTLRPLSRPSTVATLTATQGCKWDAGTLPTEAGAKLTAGRLRLSEGLATIEFTNGVQVRLEGPADLVLVSPMRCIMHSGQLLARVPPSGQGFVVETPTSVLTDFGTEFGVAVSSGTDAVVQVFEGRVDALHRETGRTEQILEGGTFEFKQSEYHSLSPSNEYVMPASEVRSETGDWLRISTAQGRGRDAFVQAMPIPPDRRSEALLLVKRPIAEMPEWERRAYLTFDLENVADTPIQAAELMLTFAPTGFGFASLVPDATFEVYGVTDESLDEWDEREINWENAPGSQDVSLPLDSRQCKLLGSFVLPQGEQSSTCQVRGEQLVDFLNADTNGLVTLVVVRQTAGIGRSDLVHGIVSRRHPSLSPPTLRLNLTSP